MTIYTLKFDSEGTSIIHVGEIYIGERIRDITIAKDGRLVLAGDLGSLIVVNRTDKDIPLVKLFQKLSATHVCLVNYQNLP